MNKKIPIWADVLLAFWVLFVCLVYFGGYFWPETIGIYTGRALVVYTFMLLITTIVLARNYLSPSTIPHSSSQIENEGSAVNQQEEPNPDNGK